MTGKPALVMGSYKMNSFLGKELPSVDSHLNSYDHGTRSVFEYIEEQGMLKESDGQHEMYARSGGTLKSVEHHIVPEPIKAVAVNLKKRGVISPVAWLQPFENVSEY